MQASFLLPSYLVQTIILNLHNLFLLELQDLYDAKQQITQALPQMLEFTLSDELKETFSSHLEEKASDQKLSSLAEGLINRQADKGMTASQAL